MTRDGRELLVEIEKRLSESLFKDFLVMSQPKGCVGSCDVGPCQFGYDLEVLVARMAAKRIGRIAARDGWFESIELAEVLVLKGVGLERFQGLGQRGEPGAKEAGHLKVAQVGMIALCVLKVASDALVWEWIASLGVAVGAALAKADVEERGESLTLVHHARLACAAGLNDGSAAIVRLDIVGAELIKGNVEVRDKGEEAVGRIAAVRSLELVGEVVIGTQRLWISGALDIRLCDVNKDQGKGLVAFVESGKSGGEVGVDGCKRADEGGGCAQRIDKLWHDCAKLSLTMNDVLGEGCKRRFRPYAPTLTCATNKAVSVNKVRPTLGESELIQMSCCFGGARGVVESLLRWQLR